MQLQTMRTETGTIQVPEIFMPISNARQTTEVFSQNGRIKMVVRRQSFKAQEIIDSLSKKEMIRKSKPISERMEAIG